MFRLRLTIDCHPRAKNGAAPHSTTGVARTSCVHARTAGGTACATPPGSISLIASRTTGTVRATLTRNRRVMSASSSLAGSSAVITVGSSAIPQIGHDPGPICRTSGCIGQVYSTLRWPGHVLCGGRGLRTCGQHGESYVGPGLETRPTGSAPDRP